MITSAQEATKSVWCSAEACENDAEPGSRLCYRCQRKPLVRLHVKPLPIGNTLRCCTCTRYLDDDSFSRKSDAPHRRYRHHECRDCTRTRRQRTRKVLTPEQKQRALERERIRRQRLRDQLAAVRAAP